MVPLNLVQWGFLPFSSYFTFYGDSLVVPWGPWVCARSTGRAASSQFSPGVSAPDGDTDSAAKGMGPHSTPE